MRCIYSTLPRLPEIVATKTCSPAPCACTYCRVLLMKQKCMFYQVPSIFVYQGPVNILFIRVLSIFCLSGSYHSFVYYGVVTILFIRGPDTLSFIRGPDTLLFIRVLSIFGLSRSYHSFVYYGVVTILFIRVLSLICLLGSCHSFVY